jgi:hypothetical protein
MLKCEYAVNSGNAKQREVCAEFKTGFFDKIKPDFPDAVFATFDTSINDIPPGFKLQFEIPGLFYYGAGKVSCEGKLRAAVTT